METQKQSFFRLIRNAFWEENSILFTFVTKIKQHNMLINMKNAQNYSFCLCDKLIDIVFAKCYYIIN